ncbi:hypothetical protein ABZT06_14480 [Streptomyces sp. NPDC005483]
MTRALGLDALGTQPDRSIRAERSAQEQLAASPRNVSQWPADVDL